MGNGFANQFFLDFKNKEDHNMLEPLMLFYVSHTDIDALKNGIKISGCSIKDLEKLLGVEFLISLKDSDPKNITRGIIGFYGREFSAKYDSETRSMEILLNKRKIQEQTKKEDDIIQTLSTQLNHAIENESKTEGSRDAVIWHTLVNDYNGCIDIIGKMQQLRLSGVVDDNWNLTTLFSHLMARAEVRRPEGADMCTCPSCKTYNPIIEKRRNTVKYDTIYCWHCGQAVQIRCDD